MTSDSTRIDTMRDEDTWEAALPPDEREGLALLKERVCHAVVGLIHPETARWICEETLWQIRTLLHDEGLVVLPDVGTLELVDLPDGVRCLLATTTQSIDLAELDPVGHEALETAP